MKMLKKYVYTLTLLAAAFGFAACTENGDYSPANAEEGTRVFFSQEATTEFTISNTSTSVAVPVIRNTAEGILEASISATYGSTDYASLFTVSPTILFEEGSNEAMATISFEYSKLTPGASYEVTINLVDETIFSNYGAASQTITIVVPEPYVYLGKGWYRDDLYASGYSNVQPAEWQVDIYENTNMPGYIFLKDPYKDHPAAANFKKVYSDVYFAINVAYKGEEGVAMIPKQKIGIDISGDGQMIVGTSQLGTYENGIITFPEKGLVVAEEFYQDGAWFANGNANNMFRVVMPGIEITDYAMEVAYNGMSVAADNKTTEALFKGTYGADVASFKYYFVEDDVTAAAAQIAAAIEAGAFEADGEVELETGLDEEDRVFEFTDGGELEAPGIYTVVVVPYNADGEMQLADMAGAAFYYAGVGAAETPAIELVGYFDSYSKYFPSHAAQGYDDTNSLIWFVEGGNKEVAALGLAGWYKKSYIDQLEAAGYSLEEIYAGLEGEALSSVYVDEINTEGYTYGTVRGLPADTAVAGIIYGKNKYGNETYIRLDGKTAAAAANSAAAAMIPGKGVLAPRFNDAFSGIYKVTGEMK